MIRNKVILINSYAASCTIHFRALYRIAAVFGYNQSDVLLMRAHTTTRGA